MRCLHCGMPLGEIESAEVFRGLELGPESKAAVSMAIGDIGEGAEEET